MKPRTWVLHPLAHGIDSQDTASGCDVRGSSPIRDAPCGKMIEKAAEPTDPQPKERSSLNIEPYTAARRSLQDQYVQLTRRDVGTPDPAGFFARAKTSSSTEFNNGIQCPGVQSGNGLHHRRASRQVLRWTSRVVYECTPVSCRLRRPGRTCSTKNERPMSISVINRKPHARARRALHGDRIHIQ